MNDPADHNTVTTDSFRRIRRIFEEALERPADKRQVYVENACVGDVAILREVNRMLDAEGQASPLLDGITSSPPLSSAPEEGRFPAGTVLAGRYRILGLLGKGGMGEVYRAYDLILNQTVALKFLSPAHISEAALIRFRNEVRIARQVSHPNVCRVYDLGMIEGMHFLSMEYIDGEDLASLLRRIGRLPQDKAMEFTRKICAGLSAAHERGVLHRDLKPANIMIDGRGQVRITDFGLAALEQEIPLSDLRSGTPAYMSPEQKAGKEVTTRSDIYSLGLVLHEMFTGKARSATQSNPTDLVRDLDPAIERLILRCLEDEPGRRPQTSLNVAMALPGADPIAAALAAGETPSPEMIAASSEKEGFSLRTAALCFAGVVVLMILAAVVEQKTGLLSRAPMPLPPQVMADHAQQLLRSIGYSETTLSPSYGIECCDQAAIDNLARYDAARREQILASHQPPIVLFWYRQNQVSSTSNRGVFPDEPAPGVVRILLDAQARLNSLSVQPWPAPTPAVAVEPWPALFSAAGLDMARFIADTPQSVPGMATDTRLAWVGTYGADGVHLESVRVEAGSWRGRPVLFKVQGLPSERMVFQALPAPNAAIVFGVLAFLISALIAWRNSRRGRVDWRGAALIGGSALAMGLGRWLLGHQPVDDPVLSGVGSTIVIAGTLWVEYLAVEPFVRRHWPDSFISWTRLCAGKVRNPLVASHVLAGILAAEAFLGTYSGLSALFSPVPLIITRGLAGIADGVSSAIDGILGGLNTGLALLLLVVVLRLVIRNIWIADLAAGFLMALSRIGSLGSGLGRNAAVVIFFTPLSMVWVWLLRRFGFLAMLVLFLTALPITATPFLFTGWMAGQTLALRLIPIAAAAWALWVIVSAQHRAGVDTTG